MRYIALRKPIETKFTGDTVTTIMVAKYTNDGALAMVATTDEGEPIANITVNLDDSRFLDNDSFYLDASQTADEIKEAWLKDGVIEPIVGVPAISGFNTYAAYRIVDPELLAEVRKANK